MSHQESAMTEQTARLRALLEEAYERGHWDWPTLDNPTRADLRAKAVDSLLSTLQGEGERPPAGEPTVCPGEDMRDCGPVSGATPARAEGSHDLIQHAYRVADAWRQGAMDAGNAQPMDPERRKLCIPAPYVAAYEMGYGFIHRSPVAMEMTRRINAVAARCSEAERELAARAEGSHDHESPIYEAIGRYAVQSARWIRHEHEHYAAVPVAFGANLESQGRRFDALRAAALRARAEGSEPAQPTGVAPELLAELERAAWSRSRRRVKAAWVALEAQGFRRPPAFPAPPESGERR